MTVWISEKTLWRVVGSGWVEGEEVKAVDSCRRYHDRLVSAEKGRERSGVWGQLVCIGRETGAVFALVY